MIVLDLTPRIIATQLLQTLADLEERGVASRDQNIAAMKEALEALERFRVSRPNTAA